MHYFLNHAYYYSFVVPEKLPVRSYGRKLISLFTELAIHFTQNDYTQTNINLLFETLADERKCRKANLNNLKRSTFRYFTHFDAFVHLKNSNAPFSHIVLRTFECTKRCTSFFSAKKVLRNSYLLFWKCFFCSGIDPNVYLVSCISHTQWNSFIIVTYNVIDRLLLLQTIGLEIELCIESVKYNPYTIIKL